MSRTLFLDDAPGERRGVVLLHGLPERLLIARAGDSALAPGIRAVGRVRRIERGQRLAFVELPDGPDGAFALSGEAADLTEGARVEVTVASAAHAEKGPGLRLIGPAEGAPRMLTAPPLLEAQLGAFSDTDIITGPRARAVADEAEDEALATTHRLQGGGRLHIESTHALVAIDVDIADARGAEPRRLAANLNALAIGHAARLLRLKQLSGLIAIDLAGKGHDGARLLEAARAGFAPDQPGVVFGPISRFGVMEMSLPRHAAPVRERLCGADGAPSVLTWALRLLRAIERAAGPGDFIKAFAPPEVVHEAQRLAPQLVARIGARFTVECDPALPRSGSRIAPK